MKHTLFPLAMIVGLVAQAASADPRAELIAAFEKAAERSQYRLEIEADNKRGPIRSRMDVQLPNRFHMKTDEAEFVSVPEGTWINAGGRWMKVPVDMSKQLQGYRLQDARDQAAAQIDAVEYLGKDTVDGCESVRYRYSATASYAGRAREDDIEVAVCERTGLPIELRSSPRKKGETIIIRYDFDAAVNIRAPN